MNAVSRRATTAESQLLALLDRMSVRTLRASIALVIIWFGGLKVAGRSPVSDLVAATLPWIEPNRLLPALGTFEVLLGLALMGRWPHPTVVSAITLAPLGGTFLVPLTQPSVAFQAGNPLLLTTIGEFVVKNIVLMAALLVLPVRGSTGSSGWKCQADLAPLGRLVLAPPGVAAPEV